MENRLEALLCDDLSAAQECMKKISRPLLLWYDENARLLPFREIPSPYRIWVSEIMLQQTRVSAVLPYYERFMQALPDVRALAEVPEEELLKLWEGLGYYSRARNLQKAAKQVMEEHGGELPDSFEALCKLPGIGDYTAGAIASIAYGKKVPAVDGNVLRVLSRVLLFRGDILEPKVKKAASALIRENMPERPGDYNQALMEIGALVCVPNGTPLCSDCPLAGICRAKAAGCEGELPVKAAKKPRKIEERTILLVCANGRVLMHRREKKGLLAGLWEYVNLDGTLAQGEATRRLNEWGFQVKECAPIGEAVHIFTHREWRMTGFGAVVDGCPAPKGYVWADEGMLREYAVPGAFSAYRKQLPEWLGRSCGSRERKDI